VRLVDVSGTYYSQPNSTGRAEYRMLAALVFNDDQGFLLRVFGPKQSIADQERAFRAMIGTLRARAVPP
jgi:hypothetical protein